MTIEQEIAMIDRAKAHWQQIGKEERAKRYVLMDQANRLVDRLIQRLATFYGVDPTQQRRSEEALGRAMKRAERRGVAYFNS